MNNWKHTTLGQVVALDSGVLQTGPFGSQLHKSDYVDSGIPCIMPANIQGIRIDLNGIAMIAEKDAIRLSKHIVKEGDIIFSRRGDVTKKALIRQSEEGYFCGTGCILVRTGHSIDSEFLTYYLNTPLSKSWIIQKAVGITMPNINTKIISDYPIKLPNITKQKAIAKILSDLDDKIELNNKINTELEAMAKLIFDYWFVQFDFPDKNGKPYKASGGKMLWNEELKREIPEGWEVGTLSDISDLIRGVSYGKDDIKEPNDKGTIPILRATNISGNVIDLENMVYVPNSYVSPKQILNKYDILITMSSGSKDHIGKNGFFYFDKEVGFGAFCAKLVAKDKFRFYLYSYTQSDFMFTTIKNECLGTNINNLNGSLVNGFKILLPPINLIETFNSKVESVYEKISNNLNQKQQLSSLRDWLLPMLMNGQVKVGEVVEMDIAAEPEVECKTK